MIDWARRSCTRPDADTWKPSGCSSSVAPTPTLQRKATPPHGRALYSAVYDRHFEVARLLLEHGADPNQEVESSADAPSIAIMNSDTKMIELLASYGAVWRIPVQIANS
jgi:hypothetical protein